VEIGERKTESSSPGPLFKRKKSWRSQNNYFPSSRLEIIRERLPSNSNYHLYLSHLDPDQLIKSFLRPWLSLQTRPGLTYMYIYACMYMHSTLYF
jgi:hypothetical protein